MYVSIYVHMYVCIYIYIYSTCYIYVHGLCIYTLDGGLHPPSSSGFRPWMLACPFMHFQLASRISEQHGGPSSVPPQQLHTLRSFSLYTYIYIDV